MKWWSARSASQLPETTRCAQDRTRAFVTREAYFDHRVGAAEQMPSMARLVNFCAKLQSCLMPGAPDDFTNLGRVISWIRSLSASVSNGLRNILKFGGAAIAASL